MTERVNRQKPSGMLVATVVCLAALGSVNGAVITPQDLTVRVWGKPEGLPDNSVNSVLQTRDGYLWVGTAGGLARFDGARFVPIALTGEQSEGSMRVSTLCEDSTGRLWIGTQTEGLFWYADRQVHPFRAESGLLDRTINSIAEDTSGTLWVGTPTGLNRIDGTRLRRFTSAEGLPSDFVSSVYAGRSG